MSDYLFTTVIGSHVWKMNRPDSDYDLFSVYVAPTRDLLMGIAKERSDHMQSPEEDRAVHELSTFIGQLVKGNFNYVTALYSPIIKEGKETIDEIRNIIPVPYANLYHSTKGLCESNLQKYITSGGLVEGTKEYTKKINVIARTALFTTNILTRGVIAFEPVDATLNDVHTYIDALDDAYRTTTLPEQMPREKEKELREWMMKIRLDQLKH